MEPTPSAGGAPQLALDLGLPPPFRAVVSTRRGGISPPPWDSQNHGLSTGDDPARVARNRAFLAAALGPAAPDWARLSQVHGRVCVRVSGPGPAGEADALWTDRPGLALAVRVADCAGVALAHPASGRLGLAHAGWRGAAAGVVSELVRAMAVPPGELWAAVSPHLGRCCFEVGPEVAEAFRGRCCAPRPGGRWSLDLGAALGGELAGLGVPPERIRAAGLCTACRRDLFFSHRRDRGATGRMVVLAWRADGA
ncbi:MAG TPA: polyphenol oxidase family protein [Candidatus Saccharimonadales bacterium]|nr:polyphenol oxidase family protein [Candidatus Saccharimonadales bacterium]